VDLPGDTSGRDLPEEPHMLVAILVVAVVVLVLQTHHH